MVGTSGRTQDWWEDFWKKKSNEYGAPNEKFLAYAEEYFLNNSAESKLDAVDIASGNGRYAIELAKIGYRVDALEYAQSGVDRISEAARAAGVEVNAHQGDFTILCSEYRGYDLVLSSGLLEEIAKDHHESAIIGYQNWTKVGGLNMIKYCLEISGRGQLVEEDFVKKFYDNDSWEIIFYKEKPKLSHSKASINFTDEVDAWIRTGTLVAKKLK